VDRQGDELRQCDVSHSRDDGMTQAQCAELRRRCHRFVRHFGTAGIELERPARRGQRQIRKWVPGAAA
jgi:hypothetical protein